MSDMERKRRALSELVERLEPLVPRNRRLALLNIRRLSQSMFYAQNLTGQIERELLMLEKEKGVEAPPEEGSRFSLRTSRQLASMYQRLVALEGGGEETESSPPAATVTLDEPAEGSDLTERTAADA